MVLLVVWLLVVVWLVVFLVTGQCLAVHNLFPAFQDAFSAFQEVVRGVAGGVLCSLVVVWLVLFGVARVAGNKAGW